MDNPRQPNAPPTQVTLNASLNQQAAKSETQSNHLRKSAAAEQNALDDHV
jgi:hypothetical protein